jgi:hypothetical protein
MVRYAKLNLPIDVKAIQNQVSAHHQEWQAHLNTAHYQGGWTVLALRSPGGRAENIVAELMGDNEYKDTAHMQGFSAVKQLLSALDCPVMAVRFLNLKAGAIIKQHNDKELAFEMGEARLHFPILTNPAIEFYMEEDLIPFKEGECWYINANLPHRVTNAGATDRIHLVVDCKVNERLSDKINSALEISHKEEKKDPELLKMMIRQFRFQNTDIANRLADGLEQQLNEAHG